MKKLLAPFAVVAVLSMSAFAPKAKSDKMITDLVKISTNAVTYATTESTTIITNCYFVYCEE